ncbi:hypothetical protein BLA29_000189 [Euroglyphus maynei]|uniref:Uncharacterized protein n=1 Tax=Euroglyphus maynei TaxID=6958 RepID=A0A1Y3ANQ3_EURMA|nr:hypothetical protein BLA29_000189 [Euroglyphus maynei]
MYFQQVIRPLRKNCPMKYDIEGTEVQHSLQRRGILTLAYGALKVVITVASVVGLLNLLNINNDYNYRQDQVALSRLQNEINRRMYSAIEKLHGEISGLKLEMEDQRITTMLEVQFSRTELLIHEMFDGQNRNFASQLDMLFPNITLGKNVPKKHWQLQGCHMREPEDDKPEKLQLQVGAVEVDKDYLLLQADAFAIGSVENQTGLEEICLSKYVGAKYLVYNRRTGCSKNTFFDPNSEKTTPFVYHSPECDTAPNVFKRSWERLMCDKKEYITPEEIVQVKTDDDYIYVYCFTQNITVSGKTSECRNKVYQFRRDQNITVNGQVRHFQRVKIDKHVNLDRDLSELVNDRMYRGEGAVINLEELGTLIKHREWLAERVSKVHLRKYFAWTIILTLLLVTTVGVVYAEYQRRKGISYRQKRKEALKMLERNVKVNSTII